MKDPPSPAAPGSMPYRVLGRTGIRISELAFGAGPIPQLLTESDSDRQYRVVQHALNQGINWFDTAAGYGNGKSEESLGHVLGRINPPATLDFHLATKVRIMPDEWKDPRGAVERSFYGSLERLQVQKVTLLQLHNSITRKRNDQPTSVTPEDVINPGGLLEMFRRFVDQGLADHLGITGIGDPESLRQVIRSSAFETMQVPFNVLNPSAGMEMDDGFVDINYGNVIADCRDMKMGVLAIRVYAGGAVFRHPPSPHTLRTPFFPLDLYRRDCERAAELASRLSAPLHSIALRFCRQHPDVHSCILGFADRAHVDEALDALQQGGISAEDQSTLSRLWRAAET